MGFERLQRHDADLVRRPDRAPVEDEAAAHVPGRRTRVESLFAPSPSHAPPEASADVPGRSTFSELYPSSPARPGLDDCRVLALRHVLGALRDVPELQHATIASADREVARRALPALAPHRPAPAAEAAATGGHAMWRVAERRAATLYRQARDGDDVSPDDPVVEAALARAGSGAALPDGVRRQMEDALGVSLARVRVHTDPVAAAAARAVRAEAFTVGEDIFFADGAFSPGSRAGQQLLAHELTHVIQGWQGRTGHGGSGLRISRPSDSLEHEAETTAARVAGGPRPTTAITGPRSASGRNPGLGDPGTSSPATPGSPQTIHRKLEHPALQGRETLTKDSTPEQFKIAFDLLGVTDPKTRDELRRKALQDELYQWENLSIGQTLVPRWLGATSGKQRTQKPDQHHGLIKSNETGEARLEAWLDESVYLKDQTGGDKVQQLILRLLADLAPLQGRLDNFDVLAQQLPALLLYLMHNSSHAPPHGGGKVQTRERAKPLYYARSQENHPHVQFLRSVLAILKRAKDKAKLDEQARKRHKDEDKNDKEDKQSEETDKKTDKDEGQDTDKENDNEKEIEKEIEKAIEKAIDNDEEQPKGEGKEVKGRPIMPSSQTFQGMLDDSLKPGVPALRDGAFKMDDELHLPVAEETYDGAKAGNIGLRKNTAASYTDMLNAVFEEVGGIIELLRLHFEIKQEDRPPDDRKDDKALAEEIGHLTSTRKKPSEGTKDEEEPHPGVNQDGSDDNLRARGLRYRASLTALIAGSVGALQFLEAYASPRNPNMTVLVRPPPYASKGYRPGGAAHDGWANLVLSFFGGLLNHLAPAMAVPVHCTRRQSFGFLRPTLTDTGESFRLSLGIQPAAYGRVVIVALHQLDAAIGALGPDTMEHALDVVEDKQEMGASDRISRYLSSDHNKMVAYRVAEQFAPKSDMNGFVTWILLREHEDAEAKARAKQKAKDRERAREPEQNENEKGELKEDVKPGESEDDKKERERLEKLAALPRLFDRDAIPEKRPWSPEDSTPPALDRFNDGLAKNDQLNSPVWRETLSRVVEVALDTLAELGDLEAALKRAALKRTLRWLLARIVNNVKKAQTLLAARDRDPVHLFTKAVVVIEDLLELVLALRSLPELDDPENQVEPMERESNEPEGVPPPDPKTNPKTGYDDIEMGFDFSEDGERKLTEDLRRDAEAREQRDKQLQKRGPVSLHGRKVGEPVEQRVTRELRARFQETNLHVYRTDSGEQAGIAAVLALVGARVTKSTEPPGITTSYPYFELPKFLKRSDLYMVDGSTERHEVAQLVDINPFHSTKLQDHEDPKPSLRPPSDEHYAWIVDITNSDPGSSEVADLVKFWKTSRLDNPAVRLILFASLLKHDELGLDKLQAGRIIVLGDPMSQLQELSESVSHPVVDDFLGMMHDISHGPGGPREQPDPRQD